MLYTRKGDDGTTKTLHCDQRLSKSSSIAEALGVVDELNSLLGYCRTQCQGEPLPRIKGEFLRKKGFILAFPNLFLAVQQNLFIIQAELAGAPGKTIVVEKITALEKIIDGIEKELPLIKSFFIPGITADGALLDYARTVARRAERRVVKAREENLVKLSDSTLSYLNRLSSLLYALARLVNYQSGIKEQSPDYK